MSRFISPSVPVLNVNLISMAAAMFNAFGNLGEYLSLTRNLNLFSIKFLFFHGCRLPESIITYGCWHELPMDVMELIIKGLDIVGINCLKCVCKSWKSLLVNQEIYAPQLPLLLLPHISDNKYLTCFSPFNGKSYKIKLPKSLNRWFILDQIIVGSSKGWLFIAQTCLPENQQNVLPETSLFLYNPFSGAVHQLPSPLTIPFFELPPQFSYYLYSSFQWYELSSANVLECIVAGVFYDGSMLAFCKLGNKRWSTFRLGNGNVKLEFADILFCKGTLYALIIHECLTTTRSCTHKFGTTKVDVRLIPELSFILRGGNNVYNINQRVTLCKHYNFVESTKEELLLILRFYYKVLGENYNQKPRTTETYMFKIDLSSCKFCRLKNLGDQAIYLSRAGSVAVVASSLIGVPQNHIYLTEDYSSCRSTYYEMVSRCLVAYNLELDTSRHISFPPSTCVFWFTPAV